MSHAVVAAPEFRADLLWSLLFTTQFAVNTTQLLFGEEAEERGQKNNSDGQMRVIRNTRMLALQMGARAK
jgi:hypothetical protein